MPNAWNTCRSQQRVQQTDCGTSCRGAAHRPNRFVRWRIGAVDEKLMQPELYHEPVQAIGRRRGDL
jgi:hypothetical protein